MPKDIAERWKIPARDRMSRHIELGANDDLPCDDPITYQAMLAARRRAVFAGQQGLGGQGASARSARGATGVAAE
ncbi:hypothetical protein R2F25_30260 [Streptomyces sp. UP1A-1]|nr:hypothetical protein [Streptomyces sp. UP1A-1]